MVHCTFVCDGFTTSTVQHVIFTVKQIHDFWLYEYSLNGRQLILIIDTTEMKYVYFLQ